MHGYRKVLKDWGTYHTGSKSSTEELDEHAVKGELSWRCLNVMAKLSRQEREWGRMFDNSTNPQEIMDLAVKLGMEPFTLQEATEAAERHARIIARRLMTTGKQKAEKSTL